MTINHTFFCIPRLLISIALLMSSCELFADDDSASHSRSLKQPATTHDTIDVIDNANLLKIALVIGNSQYKNVDPLRNPNKDAELIATKLTKLGFKVITGNDANLQQMKTLLREFVEQITHDSVALFYYAGHGIQHEGENFLLPVDANINDAYETEYFSVNLNMVIAALDQASPLLSIAFIDACRNNPFKKRGLFRNGLNKSLGGLAAVNSRAGSILSFATEPGNTAIDGSGKHSPYSSALAEKIAQPGLTVQEMLNGVGLAVMKATKGKQKPWYSSSPVARYCFAGCQSVAQENPAESLRIAIQQGNLRKIKQLALVNSKQEGLLNVLFSHYPSLITQSLSNTATRRKNSKEDTVTIQIIEAVNQNGNRVIPSERWAYLDFVLKSR